MSWSILKFILAAKQKHSLHRQWYVYNMTHSVGNCSTSLEHHGGQFSEIPPRMNATKVQYRNLRKTKVNLSDIKSPNYRPLLRF